MTLLNVFALELRLMAFTSEVMIKVAIGHVLKRINLRLLDPSAILIRVQPEGEPVALSVACDLVVELELRDAVRASEEATRLESVLIYAGTLPSHIIGDARLD